MIDHDIAVIGIGCRFPDADDKDTFADNLKSGKSAIQRFSDIQLQESGIPEEAYQHPHYKPYGAPLDKVFEFDNEYFNLTPKETRLLDPQQRLMLELATRTLGCRCGE